MDMKLDDTPTMKVGDKLIVKDKLLFATTEYPIGPLDKETLLEIKDENNIVTGVVQVSLFDIIDGDLETFMDLLSQRLINSGLLMGISYEVIGLVEDTPNTLWIKVTGDVSMEGDME